MTLTSSAKVSDIIASLQGSIGTMSKADLVSVVGGNATTADSIGTVVTKLNTQKNLLVDLANEAVANNNVLKANLANAIGSPAVGTDSMTQLTQYIQTDKNTLATAISNLGQSGSGTESLSSLVNKASMVVNNVGSGIVIAPNTADQIIPQGYYDGTASSGKVVAFSFQPGEVLVCANNTGGGTTSTTMIKIREITVNNLGCTVRVKFSIHTTNGASTIYGQVYVNGVATGTLRSTNSTTYQTYSEDFTVNSGDKIAIYIRMSTAAWTGELGTFGIYGTLSQPNFTISL